MMNVLIWQFHKCNAVIHEVYGKLFKIAIVDICSCKGEFRNNYFLQIAGLLEYLV